MKLQNLQAAEAELARYIPQVKELLGKDITLERMIPLMKLLGNPEKKLKIIHLAGTSGKTSTAYYIANLLQRTGKRIGLTVSPHIDVVTERLQINSRPLSQADFCHALGEFLEIIKDFEPQPTYFELLMAFAYWHFAKTDVDYAVIETGLGGLHDASNVAQAANKICVITDIGKDHMLVLGHNLAEIAGQKAGIIKANNQVFMFRQADEVNQVLEQKAQKQNAILNVLSETEERERAGNLAELATMPVYQQRNWLLAKRACDYIQERDALPNLSDTQVAASMHIQIPGRMDIQKVGNKTVVMDGAHNEQKMQAFVGSFQKLYPGPKAAILLAMKEGKEYQTVLPLLLPICSRLIVTTFDLLRDIPMKSINPQVLANAAGRYSFKDVDIMENPLEAYERILESSEETIIITGSFYLLSAVRQSIIKP